MITTPDGLLSTLSFVSEHLGDFTTYAEPRQGNGTIAWNNKKGEIFLFLHWDEKGVSVEIADGVEPDGRGDSNSMYTIIGYCRYQGIAHELVGASLPRVPISQSRVRDRCAKNGCCNNAMPLSRHCWFHQSTA